MSFDQTVIHCGAPALCGIKPACLFSMKMDLYGSGAEKIEEWNSQLSSDGRYILSMPIDDSRVLFFVYDIALLLEVFALQEVKMYLRKKGYPVEKGFDAVLDELLHRLVCQESFPHEVGLFLGYPIEDVIAFEENAGAGCRYSGYWKVYGDIGRAQCRMNEYKKCSVMCRNWLDCGLSVPSAAVKYRLLNGRGDL